MMLHHHGELYTTQFSVSNGAVVPALKSLKAEGFIETRKEVGNQVELCRKLRNYHVITEAGLGELREMIASMGLEMVDKRS